MAVHFHLSKGKIKPGYDATVWYATSPDGRKWTEQGMALGKGKPGTWEGASVFTPNILVAEGRYWLFYTGTSREFGKGFNPDSKIGIAVSDSPAGPWKRLDSNPALRNSDKPEDFFSKPAAIAEEVFHLTQQERSTWSFDLVIRPFGEPW